MRSNQEQEEIVALGSDRDNVQAIVNYMTHIREKYRINQIQLMNVADGKVIAASITPRVEESKYNELKDYIMTDMVNKYMNHKASDRYSVFEVMNDLTCKVNMMEGE